MNLTRKNKPYILTFIHCYFIRHHLLTGDEFKFEWLDNVLNIEYQGKLPHDFKFCYSGLMEALSKYYNFDLTTIFDFNFNHSTS